MTGPHARPEKRSGKEATFDKPGERRANTLERQHSGRQEAIDRARTQEDTADMDTEATGEQLLRERRVAMHDAFKDVSEDFIRLAVDTLGMRMNSKKRLIDRNGHFVKRGEEPWSKEWMASTLQKWKDAHGDIPEELPQVRGDRPPPVPWRVRYPASSGGRT